VLYEILLRQSYKGQTVINRRHYNSAGTPDAVSGSFALAFAFGCIDTAGVYPSVAPFQALRVVQHSDLSHLEVQVTALYDPVDFYTRPFVPLLPGLATGEAASPVLAYGLQTNRVSRAIRRGNMRVSGVSELAMESGGVIGSGMMTSLGTLADFLSDALTYDDEGNTLTFTPAVLSFEEYTTPAGNTAYRQYPTLAEQLTHAAVGVAWSAKEQVRTQGSRQYGRGA